MKYQFKKIKSQYLNELDWYYITMYQIEELIYILRDDGCTSYKDWNTWFPIELEANVLGFYYSHQEIELLCFDQICDMRKQENKDLMMIDMFHMEIEIETLRAMQRLSPMEKNTRSGGVFFALKGDSYE